MSSHTAPAPSATGEQRKFVNPTSGWVGANVFGADGKPTSIAVEPGGEVWLTPEEERMTAEAPRFAHDNPFIKEWEAVVETDAFGEPVSTETRQGTLVLSDEPPRPTASDRFVPSQRKPKGETVTGADVPPTPAQPPVQGQPAPNEVVGAPEAVPANDEALAKREASAEQPTRKPRALPS